VRPTKADYASLSVVGLELEYAIVDADLRPACLVEDAPFRLLLRDGVLDFDSGRI